MPDGSSGFLTGDPGTRTPTPQRTSLPRPLAGLTPEQLLADDQGRRRYPSRPFAVLTSEQLAAARAEMGTRAPRMARQTAEPAPGDRRPMSADDLRDARAAAYGP